MWLWMLRRLSDGYVCWKLSKLFRGEARGTRAEDWSFVVLEEFGADVSEAELWEAERRHMVSAVEVSEDVVLNVSMQPRAASVRAEASDG